MKHCQVCKVEYSDDVTFCSHCGNRVAEGNLEFSCPSCGRILGDTYEQFCPHCGQQVGNVQKDSSSKQGVSKKYIAIIAIIAILIGGYFGFKKDLINAGVIQPFTATEQYEYAVYLEKSNIEKAFYWFKKAAEQGDKYARFRIAGGYLLGYGVPKDLIIGKKMLLQLSDENFVEAQMALGMAYGWGVLGYDKNVSEAIKHLERAVENGVADNKVYGYLGDLYRNEGVVKNYNKAFEYYRLGAKVNDKASMMGLSFCYRFGYGVDENQSEAEKWRVRAEKLTN